MKTSNLLTTLALGAALALPVSASAGTGASYASIDHAIRSGNPDSIVAELERAEKLMCGSCVDLVKPLIDAKDGRLREVAGWWLAKRAIRIQVRDDMFGRLQSGDSVSARNAAEILGSFAHPDALMALETAIHDGSLSGEARSAAATAIGSIGHYAGKAMLEAALTSESAEVRESSARALREIRGNVEAELVVDLITDVADAVAQEAALTAGALREQTAVDALATLVTDRSRDVMARRDAAWALGKIGDGSAREVLRAVSEDDPSMLVRGAARSAANSL